MKLIKSLFLSVFGKIASDDNSERIKPCLDFDVPTAPDASEIILITLSTTWLLFGNAFAVNGFCKKASIWQIDNYPSPFEH